MLLIRQYVSANANRVRDYVYGLLTLEQYDIPVLEPPSLLGANFPGCIITKYPPGMEDMTTTVSAPSKKRKKGVMPHMAYDGDDKHAADSRRKSKKPKKSAKSTKAQRKKK